MSFIKSIFLVSIVFIGQSSSTFAVEPAKPTCSSVGQINCPPGSKPTCPKQYTPLCIFVGTMQLPSCLASGSDMTFYNFNLNKVGCEKSK